MVHEDIRLSLIVLAPLIGAFLSYVIGRRSPQLSGIIASGAVLVSCICSVLLWSEVGSSSQYASTLSRWI